MKNSFFFAIFLFFTVKSFGQPTPYPPIGCKATSTNIVYYNYLNSIDNGLYVFQGYAPYPNPQPFTWNSSAQATYSCYRWIVYEIPMGCKIKTSSSSSTFISEQRGYFDYSTTYCPLDDYIWILFSATACLGIIFLKRDKLNLS